MEGRSVEEGRRVVGWVGLWVGRGPRVGGLVGWGEGEGFTPNRGNSGSCPRPPANGLVAGWTERSEWKTVGRRGPSGGGEGASWTEERDGRPADCLCEEGGMPSCSDTAEGLGHLGPGGLEAFADIPVTDHEGFGTFQDLPLPSDLPPALTSDSPELVARLARAEEILSALHVVTEGCRARMVCHLAKDPEKFAPLSHLLLDPLRLEGLQQDGAMGRGGEAARERFLDLLQAVEAGRHRLCYKYSDQCSYKGEDMISQPGLKAWRIMYKVLTMKALAKKDQKIF